MAETKKKGEIQTKVEARTANTNCRKQEEKMRKRHGRNNVNEQKGKGYKNERRKGKKNMIKKDGERNDDEERIKHKIKHGKETQKEK